MEHEHENKDENFNAPVVPSIEDVKEELIRNLGDKVETYQKVKLVFDDIATKLDDANKQLQERDTKIKEFETKATEYEQQLADEKNLVKKLMLEIPFKTPAAPPSSGTSNKELLANFAGELDAAGIKKVY